VGALPLTRGTAVAIADVQMTAKRYGPVLLIGVWEAKHTEPIYLIRSLTDADDAVERYRLRFRIECMFADHKSRGFQIDKSHLAAPDRLARLLIVTSLAYVWVHTVGVFAQAHEWIERFHRKDRCDLSLYQIGMRALQYAVRETKGHTWRVWCDWSRRLHLTTALTMPNMRGCSLKALAPRHCTDTPVLHTPAAQEDGCNLHRRAITVQQSIRS
jgi:Transposase DDE domain